MQTESRGGYWVWRVPDAWETVRAPTSYEPHFAKRLSGPGHPFLVYCFRVWTTRGPWKEGWGAPNPTVVCAPSVCGTCGLHGTGTPSLRGDVLRRVSPDLGCFPLVQTHISLYTPSRGCAQGLGPKGTHFFSDVGREGAWEEVPKTGRVDSTV